MTKGYTWRIALIVAFIAASFIYLTPTLVSSLPSWWGFLPKDKIHLGLDLQGGTHLVMGVETDKAIEGALDLISTDLEDALNSQGLHFQSIARLGENKVQFVLYDRDTASKVGDLVKKKYPELEQLPVPEVARMLGLNLNTTYSRLRLARAAFEAAAKAWVP